MSIEDNIEILLNREINLNDLQILGVKIGDSIEKINKEIITETNSYQTRWIRTNKHIHFRTETESSNEIIV